MMALVSKHRRATLLVLALALPAACGCSLLGWPFVCNPRSLFVGGCGKVSQGENPRPSAYVPQTSEASGTEPSERASGTEGPHP